VFNYGNHSRDFTYIDDIVEGVIRTLDHVAQPDPNYDPMLPHPGSSNAPYKVYNIGNDQPVQLMRFIELMEQNLGHATEKNLLPMQPGDVPDTWADVSALQRDVGYAPSTSIEEGVKRFVQWYLDYHQLP
jgi:UDP-glucuronate 4-epimerase